MAEKSPQDQRSLIRCDARTRKRQGHGPFYQVDQGEQD